MKDALFIVSLLICFISIKLFINWCDKQIIKKQ
ncbi:hypothetical protein SAMN05428976_10431 [Clostridium sp. USBA 49]|jgi:hypothetical protein|nr:hypothetical protein SAMN05428976_10431 [Clostridium sp. USBA 49]